MFDSYSFVIESNVGNFVIVFMRSYLYFKRFIVLPEIKTNIFYLDVENDVRTINMEHHQTYFPVNVNMQHYPFSLIKSRNFGKIAGLKIPTIA